MLALEGLLLRSLSMGSRHHMLVVEAAAVPRGRLLVLVVVLEQVQGLLVMALRLVALRLSQTEVLVGVALLVVVEPTQVVMVHLEL